MKIITELVCSPPQQLILEEAGQFHYTDGQGEETIATFCVRCPPPPEDDDEDEDVHTQRQDALNSQMTTMYYQLLAEGCRDIKFKNKLPDPFF